MSFSKYISPESGKSSPNKILAICVLPAPIRPVSSNISPEEFRKRIIKSEVRMLTAIPGIGTKTAKRIIIELKDKFIKMVDDDMPIEQDSNIIPAMTEANQALLALGFKFKDIQNILKSIINNEGVDNTENLIKKALKLLN